MAPSQAESRRQHDAHHAAAWPLKDEASQAGKVINAFQISVGLHYDGHPQASLQKARAQILNWATKTLGAPAGLASTDAVNLKGDQVDIETISAEGNNVWGCRIEAHPTNVSWRTVHEVELIVRPAGVDLSYRQTIHKYPGPEHRAPRKVPEFIQDIAREIGLLDGHRLIDGSTWIIENEVELEEFYAFLTSSDRKLPVYMITETNRSHSGYSTLIDFESLSERCTGLAHVALMTYQMGYDWTERVGKWLSAYLGTVRTYQPGIPLDEANKHRHPLAMPDRIVNWEHDGTSGAPAFAKFLELHAMQASASPQNWRERFIPLSIIKAKELTKDVGFSENAHWKDVEKHLLRKVELLESRIIELSQEAITREAEHASIKAENAQLTSKIYQLERARPAASTGMRLHDDNRAGGSDSLADTIKRLSPRLLLIDSATESLATLSDDEGQLTEMLALLATKVLDAFLHGEDPSTSRTVRDALRASSITLESIKDRQFDINPETFTFFDEQLHEEFMARWSMVSTKAGSHRTHVYFDYDGNRQKIVVAHLPGPIQQRT